MAGDIWVYVETDHEAPTRAALGALAAGAAMTARTGGRLAAWVFGQGGETLGRALEASGGAAPDRVYHCPLNGEAGQGGPLGNALLGRRAAAAMLSRPEAREEVEAVLFPDGQMALDTAAGLAAVLGGGVVSHCRAVEWSGGEWLYLVPAFGGLAAIACPGRRPQLILLAPGAGVAGATAPARAAGHPEVIRVEPPAARSDEPLAVAGSEGVGEPSGLEVARLVVAGGMGAGDAEGWQLIAGFAASVGAALGATRPAVDEGWAPAEAMIGQSGKRIDSVALVSIGISGDLQHLVGVGEATTVIAINSDPDAPIFGRADYGIVGDLRQLVPALTRRAREGRPGG